MSRNFGWHAAGPGAAAPVADHGYQIRELQHEPANGKRRRFRSGLLIHSFHACWGSASQGHSLPVRVPSRAMEEHPSLYSFSCSILVECISTYVCTHFSPTGSESIAQGVSRLRRAACCSPSLLLVSVDLAASSGRLADLLTCSSPGTRNG